MDAFIEADPVLAGPACGREIPRRVVGRRYRVLRKGMQDVGPHQFLMLLLVVETNLDQRRDRGQLVVAGFTEEFHDRRIDATAIGGDLLSGGPCQIAAPVPGMTGACADVIGIEQEGVVGVVGHISLAVLAQQELLEKPGGMGAVPFGRACVRHGLDQLILGA